MKTTLLGIIAALSLSVTALATAPLSTSTSTSTQASALQKGEAQKGDAQKGKQDKGDAKQGSKGAGSATPGPNPSGAKDADSVIAAQLPSYPGNYCLVHGARFTPAMPAKNLVVDGQLYRVCSDKCGSKIQIDPLGNYQRLRKTIIGAQKANWPLTTCPISGDPYGGDHGQPVDHVIGTRYVKLCCGGCVKTANADPAKFLAKLDKLVRPELAKTYTNETCVISGEKLGSMGDPIEFLHGYRLVRLCCKGCIKTFHADPIKHMETLYPRKRGGKAAPKKPAEKPTPKPAPKKGN